MPTKRKSLPALCTLFFGSCDFLDCFVASLLAMTSLRAKRSNPVRSITFLLLATAYAAALAQEPATGTETAAENRSAVAVYVAGDLPDYQKEFVSTYLLNALINRETNVSDENSAAFLAAVGEEQSKRQNSLDDSIICEIGRKSGIRYVCAVVITPAPSGAFTISGRVISTKTGNSRFHGEAAGPLITMGAIALVCDTVLEKMFDGKRVFGGQTAPEPVHIAPPPQPEPVSAPINEPMPPPTDTTSSNKVAERSRSHIPPQDEFVSTPLNEPSPDTVVIKPPSARVKNVAVVETDIDAQSGASAELTSADARLITAELRREAVKNLPRGKYNVMTSETVYSQGSAVLEECADENCVIVLGSAIGADYIVRGTISKIQTRFTLTVEIYETNDGNLVASSDPIRSESLGDLLEKAGEVCAEMYKSFVNTQISLEPIVAQVPDSSQQKSHKRGISVGIGGIVTGGYGGGIAGSGGERITMPYYAGGTYLYVDAIYAELFLGYSFGNGQWESYNVRDPQNLPYMPRTYINIGLFAKYQFGLYKIIKLFPILGLDYEASISGGINEANGDEYVFNGMSDRPEASALSSLWLKFGGGIDVDLGKTVYLRSELIYGLRAANKFEYFCADKVQSGTWAEFGQGVAVRIGVGARF